MGWGNALLYEDESEKTAEKIMKDEPLDHRRLWTITLRIQQLMIEAYIDGLTEAIKILSQEEEKK